jgi:hypothetical protein
MDTKNKETREDKDKEENKNDGTNATNATNVAEAEADKMVSKHFIWISQMSCSF